jgi:hypothetical protein
VLVRENAISTSCEAVGDDSTGKLGVADPVCKAGSVGREVERDPHATRIKRMDRLETIGRIG